MLEHNLRLQIASDGGGYAKVKQFLRLARRIKVKARKVGTLSFEFADRGEWDKATRFQQAQDRLHALHSDIREQARQAMSLPRGIAS